MVDLAEVFPQMRAFRNEFNGHYIFSKIGLQGDEFDGDFIFFKIGLLNDKFESQILNQLRSKFNGSGSYLYMSIRWVQTVMLPSKYVITSYFLVL